MSPDVQHRHIELYVNEFTRDLGDEGYAAIEALLPGPTRPASSRTPPPAALTSAAATAARATGFRCQSGHSGCNTAERV